MGKNKEQISPLDELRRIFKDFPDIIESLEKKLQEQGDTLIDSVQMNLCHGTEQGSDLFKKGPVYCYGIWTRDKEGNEKPLIRISKYIGIETQEKVIIYPPTPPTSSES